MTESGWESDGGGGKRLSESLNKMPYRRGEMLYERRPFHDDEDGKKQ